MTLPTPPGLPEPFLTFCEALQQEGVAIPGSLKSGDLDLVWDDQAIQILESGAGEQRLDGLSRMTVHVGRASFPGTPRGWVERMLRRTPREQRAVVELRTQRLRIRLNARPDEPRVLAGLQAVHPVGEEVSFDTLWELVQTARHLGAEVLLEAPRLSGETPMAPKPAPPPPRTPPRSERRTISAPSGPIQQLWWVMASETRLPTDDGGALQRTLAEAVGLSLYEIRSRFSLLAGHPAVLGSFESAEQAEAFAAPLGGVGTFIVSPEEMPDPGARFAVRAFELEAGALVVESREGDRRRIEGADVTVVLSGTRIERARSVEVTTREVKSAMRTHGGRRATRKEVERNTVIEESASPFFHVYTRAGDSYVFAQHALQYQGLGDAMALSSNGNYALIRDHILEMAPPERVDDRTLEDGRLMKQILGPTHPPHRYQEVAVALFERTLGV